MQPGLPQLPVPPVVCTKHLGSSHFPDHGLRHNFMIWVESVQLFACVLVFIFSSIFAFAFFRSAGAKIHLSSRALTHMKVTSRHSFTLFLEQYAPETTFHVGICLLADQPKLAKKMWVSFLQLFRSARTSCTTSVPLDQLYSYINHHRTIPSLVFLLKINFNVRKRFLLS